MFLYFWNIIMNAVLIKARFINVNEVLLVIRLIACLRWEQISVFLHVFMFVWLSEIRVVHEEVSLTEKLSPARSGIVCVRFSSGSRLSESNRKYGQSCSDFFFKFFNFLKVHSEIQNKRVCVYIYCLQISYLIHTWMKWNVESSCFVNWLDLERVLCFK